VPLDYQAYEFRLLTLHQIKPDATGSIVSCTLDHRTLLSPSHYHALSYLSRDPGDTGAILVNGHVMHVMTNLDAALREPRVWTWGPYGQMLYTLTRMAL
jgi:hypothetical protein